MTEFPPEPYVNVQNSQSKCHWTLAGTGEEGEGGDGGPAAEAQLFGPHGVAVDAAGNVYVADLGNQRVRRIDASTGRIETLAGRDLNGYDGDGGPATEAALSWPYGVAVDAAGNVYVADSGNHRVRRIDALTGRIETLAGTGEEDYGGDGGPATEAALSAPEGVAVDAAGSVYVADSRNQRVRRIDALTGRIETLAGMGTGAYGYSGDGGPATEAALSFPVGVAVDAAGNVYVADTGNHRVRRIDASTGRIETLAGTEEGGYSGDGGPATEAALYLPRGVAVDAAGNVYVADTGNHRVRRIDASTGWIETLAGTGEKGYSGDGLSSTEAALSFPIGVAVDAAGNVYVADSGNGRVRVIRAGVRIGVPLGSSGESIALEVSEGGAIRWPDGRPALDGETFMASSGNEYTLGTGADGRIIATYLQVRQTVELSYGGSVVLARDENRTWWLDGQSVIHGDRHESGGNEYILEKFAGTWNVVATRDLLTIPVNENGELQPPGGIELEWTTVIETLAGTGEGGYGGDGGLPTEALVHRPTGVAVDAAGNVYVADTGNHRVRRIDASTGRIETLAGTGEGGYGGDGGPATKAILSYPTGVAVDAAGNVYVADLGNHRVRRIDASTGRIETLTGRGGGGYGGDGGPAAEALVYGPTGVAVDATGNVYVAVRGNSRVRRIDASTGRIETLAGTGEHGYGGDGGPAAEALLFGPTGVAVDAAGNVYVADYVNSRVRRIDAATGWIETLAGTGEYRYGGDDGPATEAALNSPYGVAVDAAGNVYVADSGNDRVRRVDASTGWIETLAGTGEGGYGGDGGPAAEALLFGPTGVAVDAAGNVYVADYVNSRVRRIDAATGWIETLAGTGEYRYGGDDGPATEAALNSPYGVAVDAAGNVYVADSGNDRVRRVDASTGWIETLAGTGEGGYGGDGGPAAEALLFGPTGVAVDAAGNVYVADYVNHRVRVIGPAARMGVPLGSSGESITLEVSPAGRMYRDGRLVVENSEVTSENGDVYVLTRSAERIVLATYLPATQSVQLPTGVAVMLARDEDGTWRIGETPVRNGYAHSHDGQEYVLELADGQWRTARYAIRSVAGSTAVPEGISAVEASLFRPMGVTTDSAGNVYVAEPHRVRRVDVSGVISTIAGSGDWGYGGGEESAVEARLAYPIGMASDDDGNLYVADRNNHRVRKIDPLGVISTLAGTGRDGYGGDGGAANEALLSYPTSVATDSAGNVYVADRGNHRVRKIDAATGVISTLAGTGGDGYGGDGGAANEALLSYPTSVATDSAGNVYVADEINYRVRRIDASTSVITTLAGTGSRTSGWNGGPAEGARLAFPNSMAVDGAGTLFFVDQERVWKLDASGVVVALAGTGESGYLGDGGPAVEAELAWPYDVTTDGAGNVYVADRGNHRVRKIDAGTGTITTLAGTGESGYGGDGGPATEAHLSAPNGVAVDVTGNVYVADSGNRRIRKIDAASGVIETLAGTGERTAFSGENRGDGGPAARATFSLVFGVSSDASGNVFVPDADRVRRLDTSSGNIETILEADGDSVWAVAVDDEGDLYVGSGSGQIRMIDSGGIVSVIAGTGRDGFSGDGAPAAGAELSVYGIAVDRFGAIWFTDGIGRRIRVLEPWPGQN